MANDPFRAINHPIRRDMIERLAAGPASVSEVSSGFGVSKPTITRHLKVLEAEQVVSREVVGRQHVLRLNLESMIGAVVWIERQRSLWERMFDAVDEHLSAISDTHPSRQRPTDPLTTLKIGEPHDV